MSHVRRGPKEKYRRKLEADIRTTARAARSPEEQLLTIGARGGDMTGREGRRLQAQIDARSAPTEAPKRKGKRK